MRKVFVLVAVVVAAVVVAIVWMVRHHDKAPNAQHNKRCPPVSARAQRPLVASAQVSGHVTKKTGGAIAGATVAVVQTGLGADFGVGDSPTMFAITDATGAWRIENLPSGDYVASAAANEFLPVNQVRFAIAAGERRAGIDMSLEAGGALVRGMVSDYDGKSIVGARIEVARCSEAEVCAQFLAVTGADGKYELSLPDGEHWLHARHDDFTLNTRSVEVASKPQTVDFKLVRGGTIRGIVIERATGKVVPGAIVDAPAEPRRYWGGQAITDGEGKFVLHGVAPGVVSLQASAAGVASTQPIRVGVGMGEKVDSPPLLVDPAMSICGRIVEKGTQKGIAGARIHAASASMSSATPHAIGPSSSDGTFQIVGVRRGRFGLYARAENKIPVQGKQVDVGDTDVTGVIVEMETGVTLTGRVDPPVKASISIVLQGERGAGKVMDSVYYGMVRADSDTSGVWNLDHVPPGKFVIVAKTNEGTVGTLPIVVADRDQKDLAVTLQKRASVSGRVIDTKGAPVVGLKIMAQPDPRTRAHLIMPYWESPGATSDANGSFKIVGLAAGTYKIVSGEIADQLLTTMEHQKPPPPIEVAAGAALTNIVVTVEPHDGVIRGVTTFGGKPARDVWVTARLQRPDGSLFPGDLGNSEPVLSDANGNFVIDHLRERSYTLVAEGPRAASRGEKAGVKPGDTTTIELQSLGALTGHVKLRGRPVTSYDLRCRRGTVRAEPIDVHIDAADGRYALDHLTPGRYWCGASTNAGNAADAVDVASATATLELTLVPWATITGRAVSALDGAPVPHLPAQAYSYSGADDQVSSSAFYDGDKRPTSEANGRFTIEHVANGPGHVSLWDQPVTHPIGHKAYTVTPGARIDIGMVLVIPPRAGDRGTLGMDVQLSGDAFEVTTVSADGPAAHARIVVGDKITAIQGHTIAELTPDTVRRLLVPGAIGAGQTLKLTLARGTTVNVTVAKL